MGQLLAVCVLASCASPDTHSGSVVARSASGGSGVTGTGGVISSAGGLVNTAGATVQASAGASDGGFGGSAAVTGGAPGLGGLTTAGVAGAGGAKPAPVCTPLDVKECVSGDCIGLVACDVDGQWGLCQACGQTTVPGEVVLFSQTLTLAMTEPEYNSLPLGDPGSRQMWHSNINQGSCRIADEFNLRSGAIGVESFGLCPEFALGYEFRVQASCCGLVRYGAGGVFEQVPSIANYTATRTRRILRKNIWSQTMPGADITIDIDVTWQLLGVPK